VSDEELSVLRRALISEGIALAAMAIALWYMGPGKIWVDGVRHRCRMMMSTRNTAIDVQVQQFAAEVSRWEHEQAAQPDR
jgi:hypothetical protein